MSPLKPPAKFARLSLMNNCKKLKTVHSGSSADLESAADNLFTSPPHPTPPPHPQPLAFSSLSLRTPAKAVPPTPGTVLQNKIQRNIEQSLGDSLNIHLQQQMGSFQASMLEAFQSLREELTIKKPAEVEPSSHASKPGPSSNIAAHLDLPPPRSSTNAQSEAMDVDVGPALPPRLVLNQTTSDQYVAPSKAIPKDSSYSHKKQSHRQTVAPSSTSDQLDEDSDEPRIHSTRPKKHSDKSKHKSRSRYVSSSEEDHSPVARHRSSKPSRAQPSGAASDQDLPQHNPDPPYYREVALSDIPSLYSEEVDTFRRILSLPDPRDSMPRSSTSVLGLDDEIGRQELRPRGPSSILPLSSVIKDAFDKFQHDFKAANLAEGKYVKPPPSTSKWYKGGQPTFQDKIQELNTDFAKICITPRPPGAPVAKVPLPVLKELEHQARQNISTLNFTAAFAKTSSSCNASLEKCQHSIKSTVKKIKSQIQKGANPEKAAKRGYEKVAEYMDFWNKTVLFQHRALTCLSKSLAHILQRELYSMANTGLLRREAEMTLLHPQLGETRRQELRNSSFWDSSLFESQLVKEGEDFLLKKGTSKDSQGFAPYQNKPFRGPHKKRGSYRNRPYGGNTSQSSNQSFPSGRGKPNFRGSRGRFRPHNRGRGRGKPPIPNDSSKASLSPPVGSCLRSFKRNWLTNKCSQNVLNIITNGYVLPFRSKPNLIRFPLILSEYKAQQKDQALATCIQSLLSKNAIERVENVKSLGFYSRLFLVPKPHHRWRPVIDLSRPNTFLHVEKFKMETPESIRTSLVPGEWVSSIDLSDAYLHIPIHPNSRKYLRFCYKAQVFQFTSLPFGLATAPQVFTMIVKEVKLMALSRGLRIHQYLDDWLIRSQSQEEAQVDTQAVVDLTQSLGWIINQEKSELKPTQVFSFVGYEYHLDSALVRTTHERWLKLQDLILRLKSKRVLTARCLMSLIGLLASTEKMVPEGRLHMRPFQFHLKEHWRYPQSLDNLLPWTEAIVAHLDWWQNPSNVMKGSDLHPKDHSIQLFTDASNEGWGAHLDQKSTKSLWSDREKRLHINVLELKAVSLALRDFKDQCQNQTVLVATDNSTVVAYINKQGGTHSAEMCALLWKIMTWCHHYHITLKARHIPGCLNVMADLLSRSNQVQSTEWSLHPQVFKQICQKWFTPHVDLFATHLNHKLPLYVSPIPDPRAWDIDALNIDWTNLTAYAYPPTALLHKVIQKIKQCHCLIIVIAPGWPGMPWFWDLVQLSTEIPLKLPVSTTLLKQSHKYVFHNNPQQLNLHAWCVSRSGQLQEQGFSVEVAERIAAPQWSSTRTIYKSKWALFEKWCRENSVDFSTPSVKQISDFFHVPVPRPKQAPLDH